MNESVMYWISQILGALVAVAIAASVTGVALVPALGEGVTSMNAIIVEALFTFALVSVVINTAATKATNGNSYYGLAI
jgi:aquaporin Z